MRFIKRAVLYLIAILPTITFTEPIPPLAVQPGSVRDHFAPEEVSTNGIIPGKYIVSLREDVNITQHIMWANDIQLQNIAGRLSAGDEPPSIKHIYEIGSVKGYAGSFDDATIRDIRNSPHVVAVEPDRIMRTHAVQKDADWGLGAISHRKPNHNTYPYYKPESVRPTYAYVIDSGVNDGVKDIRDRMSSDRKNFVPGTKDKDLLNHGTGVAAIIAGDEHGVSKTTNIISVKVVCDGEGKGSLIYTLDGFQWAVKHIKDNNRVKASVINMSLGAGESVQLLDNLIESAFHEGILTVVAAGNDNVDARFESPASANYAITVGAITKENYRWLIIDENDNLKGSNYGPSVNIFAPGAEVLTSGNVTGKGIPRSGTSMASAFVTGLICYYRAIRPRGDFLDATDAYKMLITLATQDVLHGIEQGSPNMLAFNGCDGILKPRCGP